MSRSPSCAAWPLLAFGLRFRDDGTLDAAASREAVGDLARIIASLRVPARIVVHEFREATPAQNKAKAQREIDSLKAAGLNVTFVAAGSDAPRQQPVQRGYAPHLLQRRPRDSEIIQILSRAAAKDPSSAARRGSFAAGGSDQPHAKVRLLLRRRPRPRQRKDEGHPRGKGAGLAEMTNIGVPVPPGFTISTEVCTYFYAHDKTYPPELKQAVAENLARVEKSVGRKFGDANQPLLVSVRSGARASMPA